MKIRELFRVESCITITSSRAVIYRWGHCCHKGCQFLMGCREYRTWSRPFPLKCAHKIYPGSSLIAQILALTLNCLLNILLHGIVPDLSGYDLLHPEHTWISGVLHCSFDAIPHPFALLPIAFLLDCRYTFVLPFCLGIDKAVAGVNFVEALGLFPEVRLANAS